MLISRNRRNLVAAIFIPENNESNQIFQVGKAPQSSISCHLHKRWRVHKSCKILMEMKSSTIFCALLAIVVGSQLISVHTNGKETVSKPEAEEIYLEENKPISGMFFSSEYVTEEYEYDDSYCLRYDDPDANMFDTEIVVDRKTYESVIEAIKSGKEMTGSLVLNNRLSCHWQQVFTFLSENQ